MYVQKVAGIQLIYIFVDFKTIGFQPPQKGNFLAEFFQEVVAFPDQFYSSDSSNQEILRTPLDFAKAFKSSHCYSDILSVVGNVHFEQPAPMVLNTRVIESF